MWDCVPLIKQTNNRKSVCHALNIYEMNDNFRVLRVKAKYKAKSTVINKLRYKDENLGHIWSNPYTVIFNFLRLMISLLLVLMTLFVGFVYGMSFVSTCLGVNETLCGFLRCGQ